MNAVQILVAVHGHEPAGWVHEVPRLIAAHGLARLRVLMVLDAPSVAFTSLLPAARRRFDAALAETRRLEEQRVSATVGELIDALPFPPEVRRVRIWQSDPGRAIVARAALWPADVVIVGRDGRSRLQRAAPRRCTSASSAWPPARCSSRPPRHRSRPALACRVRPAAPAEDHA